MAGGTPEDRIPARRVAVIVGVAAAMTAVALALDPVPQDPAYHRFADTRAFLGIPNFGDVASNLAFLAVGGAGLAFVLGPRGRARLDRPGERAPYVVFFAAVALVTAGSIYYHWAPANGPLFWDRLPISVAFMALLAAFVADRVDLRIGVRVALPVLVIVGAAVTWHWWLSEAAGQGDLRFYILLQAVAVVAIVLLCLMFPGRVTTFRHVGWMLAWYAMGKGLEFADATVYGALGVVGGHTLKHLVSALAATMVLAMLRRREKRSGI